MEEYYLAFIGFLCFTMVSGRHHHSTARCLNETRSGIMSLDSRNTRLMHRFVQERFDGNTPAHHRLEFTGIQQIEENMKRLDESSNGSFPRSDMSSHEAGTIYLLHYDTMRMFRTALITMLDLEFDTDGEFMSNLTDMMRCMHIPVKRLEILVERHPCNTESSFNNFTVEFETTSSGQVCSGTCLHRQSYHILEKFDYFLRRAENTFTSIIFM